MLALWMLYAMAVGVLVTGAAAVLDGRGVLAGRGRWAWGLALIAALVIPVARPQMALHPPTSIRVGEPVVVAAPAGTVSAGRAPSLVERAERILARWSGPLAGAWAGASAVLLALLLAGALSVRRRRRSWHTGEIDGTPVLISDGLGPALVGLTRPEIVVPAWVQELDAADRALILAHEEEHRRRHDPALLAAGLLAPVLFPWSPAMWWGFSRFRHAVEADCDHRVLATGLGSPVRYARLLVEVGSRVVAIVPVSAGFGENTSSLERRVRAMLDSRIVGGVKGAVIRGVAAAVLLLGACLVTNPTAPVVSTSPRGARTPGSPADTAGAGLLKKPVFTPYTVAPRILNKDQIVQAMDRSYPTLLRDAGIGGTVVVYFFIDANGDLEDTRIFKSSGYAQLDSAALKVARMYRFGPALDGDKEVPVWVQFPITFQVVGATSANELPPPRRPHTPLADKPVFTPYTVAPRILNKADIVHAMEQTYPPVLRNAGLGGTVVVYMLVGADGNVQKTQIFRTSGRPALDAAALSVAKTYRFSPAMNKGKKVAVWIQFPITFAVH